MVLLLNPQVGQGTEARLQDPLFFRTIRNTVVGPGFLQRPSKRPPKPPSEPTHHVPLEIQG